ncbi:MAG: hypothetical protein FWH35_10345 [Treponema sp.]|nr:hypothetical protein [Treponema sp.]
MLSGTIIIKNKYIFLFLLLSLSVSFLISSCKLLADKDDEIPGFYSIENGVFTIGQYQVYEPNNSAVKISEAYFEYYKNLEVYPFVIIPNGSPNPDYIAVGGGKIKEGILEFTIPSLESKHLRDWDFFKTIAFREWNIANKIDIDETTTKGNYVFFSTVDKKISRENPALNWENVIAINNPDEVSMESVIIIYVNKDCNIKGKSGEGEFPGSYLFTCNSFNLSLKKGWNLFIRRVSYGKSGKAEISIEDFSNNNLRWVIRSSMN